MQFQLITFLRLVLEELKSVFYFGDAHNLVYKKIPQIFFILSNSCLFPWWPSINNSSQKIFLDRFLNGPQENTGLRKVLL